MKRNRRAAVVALLVVVALALATATLANPTATGSGVGAGSQSGDGFTRGDGSGGTGGTDGGTRPGGGPLGANFGTCLPFLLSGTFFAIALVVLVLVVALIRWRTNLMVAIAIVLTFAAPVLFLHAFLTKCGTRPEDPTGSFSPLNISNQTLPVVGGTVGGAANAATSPPVVLLVLVLVVAALFLLFVRGSGDDAGTEELADPEADQSLRDVASAAGAAADRIEGDTAVENAVYRAWRDMTDHLDIDSPATTTPSEFAAVAREAGMTPEHVDTLTDLFREVRYGGEPVTEERERRALDALRDIERTYGEEGEG